MRSKAQWGHVSVDVAAATVSATLRRDGADRIEPYPPSSGVSSGPSRRSSST